MTPFQKKRLNYKPELPQSLSHLMNVTFQEGEKTKALGSEEELKKLFPNTFGQPILHPVLGPLNETKPLRVGVVLSGGQAAGGHNVITGLFDALKTFHKESLLFGFLGGPLGIIQGAFKELLEGELANYRNQGGFDLIGSGRTKIETDEQLEKSLQVILDLNLDGLVVIGGDDSNTNAAILAEFFLQRGCKTKVIGVPKTIDGDLKHEYVEISFGFDTACKTYSEMISNIARDAISAKKYTHFIKLMGRSASHIAFECALQTHPNVTLIGEEISQKNQTLAEITSEIADVIEKRGNEGKNFGVILIPEGIIEFIPEMKVLFQEINQLLLDKKITVKEIELKLSDQTRKTFGFLPNEIQQQLLLDRDPHGNVQVSHIETEKLISTLVGTELKRRALEGRYHGKYQPIHHFFGYEGRAAFPSNFDATYCYSLGFVAALLIKEEKTGYMSSVRYLQNHPKDWEICGIPLVSLMNIEVRNAKLKPVIQKALVNTASAIFKTFQKNREKWGVGEDYQYPGPIQYEGDPAYTDTIPHTLIIN